MVLDKWDKQASLPLQMHTSWPVTCTLILFAHVFNRFYITIPLFTCILVGAFRINPMLYMTNHHTVSGEISAKDRFLYGVFFLCIYAFTLTCAALTF